MPANKNAPPVGAGRGQNFANVDNLSYFSGRASIIVRMLANDMPCWAHLDPGDVVGLVGRSVALTSRPEGVAVREIASAATLSPGDIIRFVLGGRSALGRVTYRLRGSP